MPSSRNSSATSSTNSKPSARSSAASEIDRLAHKLLELEQEAVFVNAALKRLEAGGQRMQGQLGPLEKRLGRVEKRLDRVVERLDDLVAAKPRYARCTEVQDLRGRVTHLKTRVQALEKRRR